MSYNGNMPAGYDEWRSRSPYEQGEMYGTQDEEEEEEEADDPGSEEEEDG